MSTSAIAIKHADQNQTWQNGRVFTYSDIQRGPAYRQRPFQDGACLEKIPFLGNIANKCRRPTIFQLSIEGLTESQMNVLHYLALQFKAFVILLQETHCINAEKVVLPSYQLAESSLNRTHTALPCLSTSDRGIRFWFNLHLHGRLSGFA